MTHRSRAAVAALAALALAGCTSSGSGGGSSSTSASSPAATTGSTDPGTSAPTGTATSQTPVDPGKTAAPLGPDVSCMDPMHCYFRNPKKMSDAELEKYIAAAKGGSEAPKPAMKPWAFVVLNIGDAKIAASSEPNASGKEVTDQYGILNHRTLFAYCRVGEGGGEVTASTPREKIWYQIEPFSPDAPAKVWMNGKNLYPYEHNGAIPAC